MFPAMKSGSPSHSNAMTDKSSFMLPLARIPKSSHPDGESARKSFWKPETAIYEDTRQFIVVVELPGIDPQSVELDIDDNKIQIKGLSVPFADKNTTAFPTGWDPGPFTRLISLPACVEKERVQFHHENGALTMFLPKKAPSDPKTIIIHFEN